MKNLFLAAAFFGALLSTHSSTAEEIVPLDIRIERILQRTGISSEGVQMTEEQQDRFLLLHGNAHPIRSAVEMHLREIERERVQAASSAPSLRSLLSGGEPEPRPRDLSAREERHVIRALRGVGFTDINLDTLTPEQRMDLLTLSRATWIKPREVRRILSGG